MTKAAVSKIAITIDDTIPNQINMLVKSNCFPNRRKAIQEAVIEKLSRIEKSRLAQECARLDPQFERFLAEEGISVETEK